MAQLPTSLGLPQPSVSDGGDLLRMAVLMSKESADSLNKSFDDFKSTMTTSANRQLASAFANGIASGLSPDEAFKQASGNINSWTSAESINNALMQRNMEKEALLRENQDRRAEERARRENLDWEGENSASESNLLYQRAYAENNKKLYDQATALANSLDAIGKKYAKPTDLAGRQDTFATNAMNRARAKAEIKKINDDLLAKQFQAMYLQDRASHPDESSYSSLARTASALKFNSAEEGQLFALAHGLSAGTETIDERAKTKTNALNFSNTAQSLLNYYQANKEKFDMGTNELNSLLGNSSKLTDQQKKDREGIVDSLVPEFIDAAILDQIDPYTGLPLPMTKLTSEDSKQVLQKYLAASNRAERQKVLKEFVDSAESKGAFFIDDKSKKDYIGRVNAFLKTKFTDNPNGYLSFTPEVSKTYLDAINSQDVNGTRRDEVASRNSLKAEELEMQKASAEISQLTTLAQDLYFRGDTSNARAVEAEIKARKEALQQKALDFNNKYAMANKGPAIATIYKNYAPVITGEKAFDLTSLKDAFGEDKAKTLMDTYAEVNKELKKQPDLVIPDEAVRAAIITNPDETDEDEIIKIATIIKPELLAFAQYLNVWSKVTGARDNVSDGSLNAIANKNK